MQLVWLSLLASVVPLASAADDQLTCAIDGAGSLDSAVNAGVFLWAATNRCPKGAVGSDDLKCEIDVASAIQSVTDMANTVAKAVDSCAGGLGDECGEAAGGLVSAIAGLTAGAGQLTYWITKDEGAGGPVDDVTNNGKCIMGAKTIMSDIFQAGAAIKAAKADCTDEKVCAVNSLTVVNLLSGLGSAIAAVVGDCSSISGAGNKRASESGDLLALVAVLDNVAKAGITVSQQCKVPSQQRLYSAITRPTQSTSDGFSTSSLVAFAMIPMAAVIGFIGGRRNKAARNINDIEVPDVE